MKLPTQEGVGSTLTKAPTVASDRLHFAVHYSMIRHWYLAAASAVPSGKSVLVWDLFGVLGVQKSQYYFYTAPLQQEDSGIDLMVQASILRGYW